jgi:hypothetical protein
MREDERARVEDVVKESNARLALGAVERLSEGRDLDEAAVVRLVDGGCESLA